MLHPFKILIFIALLPITGIAQKHTVADTTKLIQQLSKTTNPSDKRLILKDLSDLYSSIDPEREKMYLKELEAQVRGKKLPYWDGYVLMKKARYVQSEGLLDSAIVLFQRSDAQFRRADSIEQALLTACIVSNLHVKAGRFEKASNQLAAIDAEVGSGKYPRALAALENQKALYYHYQGQRDSAAHHYEAAIQLYRKNQDTSMLVRTMYNRYLINRGTLSGDEKRLLLEELLAVSRTSDEKRTIVSVLNSLAYLYEKDRADYGKSHDYALEAYKLVQEFNFYDVEIDNLITLANLALLNGDTSLANTYIMEAEGKIDHRHTSKDRATLLYMRGEFQLSTGQYALAQKTFQNGLDLNNADKQLDWIRPAFMLGLGKAHYHQKNHTQAGSVLQRGRAMAVEAQNADWVVDIDIFLTNMHLELGNYPGAEKAASSAIDILKSLQRQRSLAEGYRLLSLARRKQGKYEMALLAQDRYLVLNDSLKNIDQLRSLTKKQQAFEFEREKERIAAAQAQKEVSLKAKARNSRTIALSTAVVSLLIGGFFLQSRRKNKVISAQNQQLEQLNATKDRIFAIIGHDMRKPALAFRGMTQKINYLLQKQDYARLTALGNQLEESAYSLNTVTDNLLNWALLQKNIVGYQPQSVVLQQVAEELQSIFATAARNKNIRLSILPDEGPQQVFADPLALRTILRNLIDNAIKYTPEGGAVTVTATSDGEWVNIGVQDSGIGIPEAEQKDLFVLRNDKSREGTAGEKGTGLGLHLAHELAKINKGALALNTRIVQGTSFELRLPRAAVAPAQ